MNQLLDQCARCKAMPSAILLSTCVSELSWYHTQISGWRTCSKSSGSGTINCWSPLWCWHNIQVKDSTSSTTVLLLFTSVVWFTDFLKLFVFHYVDSIHMALCMETSIYTLKHVEWPHCYRFQKAISRSRHWTHKQKCVSWNVPPNPKTISWSCLSRM